MKLIVPAAAVGIALGAIFFRYLDAGVIKLIVGTVAVTFSVNWWLNRKKTRAPAKPNMVKGGFWSGLAGFTSFVAHAGGPPLNVYLLPLAMEKSVYIGTCVVFFASINLIKLAPYAWLGQFTTGNLLTSAVLAPLVPVGIGIGVWAQRRINDRVFYGICYAALVVTGIKLLHDGLKPLIGG